MGTGKRVSFEGDPPDLPPPERSENDTNDNGEEEEGTDGSEDGGGEEGPRGELEAQRGAEEEEDEEEEGDEEELEGDDLFDAFMIAADKGQVKRLERLLDRVSQRRAVQSRSHFNLFVDPAHVREKFGVGFRFPLAG